MTFGLREREREWQIPFPNFGNGNASGKFHSHFREQECKWKIPFPFLRMGMRVANSISDFRDGNWRAVFPEIPGYGNSRSPLCQCIHLIIIITMVIIIVIMAKLKMMTVGVIIEALNWQINFKPPPPSPCMNTVLLVPFS